MEIFSLIGIIITVILLDFIWLNFVARKFYLKEFKTVGNIKNNHWQPNWIAACFVYVVISLGIFIFVMPRSNNPLNALIYGALLGILTYGLYDLTNKATLKGYSWKLTVVDSLWGAIIYGVSSFIGKLLI